MLRSVLLTAIFALSLTLLPSRAITQAPSAASEEVKTRPNKAEILGFMQKVGRMTRAQQDSRISQITQSHPNSKTPRSDFEFCVGLAYRGNAKAQACVARAFERGLGIVVDLSDAYVWYALALENPIDDAAFKKSLEEDKERVTLKLRLNYPSPSDDELEDLVTAERNRLTGYREEIAKAEK
jgi:hypothetical protein